MEHKFEEGRIYTYEPHLYAYCAERGPHRITFKYMYKDELGNFCFFDEPPFSCWVRYIYCLGEVVYPDRGQICAHLKIKMARS